MAHRLMPPLSIEYRRLGLLPTCLGNEALRVSGDGEIRHRKNHRECETDQLWSEPWRLIGRLEQEHLADLWQAVAATESLAPLTALAEDEEDEEDGGYEELLIVEKESTRRYLMRDFARRPVLAEVARRLWDALARAKMVAGSTSVQAADGNGV
ncbi:hypothetical protein ACHHRT_05055 [Desulfurivibrio sp. D14AmB]|uniref:hypothetical protein n=1 Tax=Desulfurivibrio sp. D14AmB TaxID=3374370 RepID=UPI00376F218A